MRRSSIAMAGGGEPLIVVEESCAGEEETEANSGGDKMGGLSGPRGLSIDQESPPDPYLLSPWRDTRKHSLPTPACTSGPTASQVRRLSERGEGVAREAREAAFLATLSQAPPQPGGRRHSVVTISRVPQSLFGRGRRESVAAFPALARSRRDSGVGVFPPSTENLGSCHNLQLDIMDDIVAARKVRMRLWNSSNERVCEVQPLDERAAATSPSVRYTHRGRRHSDFVGAPLPPIPARRRASEMPPPIPPRTGVGIVCTDTDLHHLLDALTSSATEINRYSDPRPAPAPDPRRRLADARSSSFDASTLRERVGDHSAGWFTRRHQTLAVKKKGFEPQKTVTFAKDTAAGDAAEVLWDRPSGSVVDASALGSAIEVFLRKSGGEPGPSTSGVPPPLPAKASASKAAQIKPVVPPRPTTKAPIKGASAPGGAAAATTAGERWYSEKGEEEEGAEGCDASLCSTLKDLFVK